MSRPVLAAAVPVIPVFGGYLDTEFFLFALIVGLVEERIIYLGTLGDRFEQLYLLRTQGIEDFLYISGL